VASSSKKGVTTTSASALLAELFALPIGEFSRASRPVDTGTESKVTATNTEVQVTKRVLWVGGDAYPLQNIARAQVRTLHPERGTPVKNFLKDILRWVGLGILALIAMTVVGVRNSLAYVLVILLILFLISVLKLIRAIGKERRKIPYYLLVLQTSGDPRTLLASTDGNQIYELVQTIMAAIDDAAITYHNWISNYYGDIIRQYGNENIGKMMA
jgi:hypothetical protein